MGVTLQVVADHVGRASRADRVVRRCAPQVEPSLAGACREAGRMVGARPAEEGRPAG